MAKIIKKEYKRGEILEVLIYNRYYPVIAIQGKRVIVKTGSFRFSEIEGWHLPWGYRIEANLHNILPLCNKGSQTIF